VRRGRVPHDLIGLSHMLMSDDERHDLHDVNKWTMMVNYFSMLRLDMLHAVCSGSPIQHHPLISAQTIQQLMHLTTDSTNY